MSEKKLFAKYVSQNILGMLGISVYILADTFFISMAEGADGITALNLVLPVYSLIFAIGAMMGVGSAIRFKILRARNDRSAETYFSNALLWALVIGLVIAGIGIAAPQKIVALLGGDDRIVAVGKEYTGIFMMFAPFFMWNHICNAFVRNDGAPAVAMTATLCSSLFNIVFDYVLMFPLGMGMRGAALATALSPVLGVAICCTHLLSKKSTVTFQWALPSLKKLLASCQLGISAFVGEISSGVTTVVFNMIILRIAGNVGVAAYGVVANTSLVAAAVLGVGTSLVLAALVIVVMYLFAEPVTAVFNKEKNAELAAYAVTGLKLYFIGFAFAGFNIVGTGILSAAESAKRAFIASVSRGFVAIILCAFVLSALMGMNGVWLAFPAAEFLTSVLVVLAFARTFGGKKVKNK